MCVGVCVCVGRGMESYRERQGYYIFFIKFPCSSSKPHQREIERDKEGTEKRTERERETDRESTEKRREREIEKAQRREG